MHWKLLDRHTHTSHFKSQNHHYEYNSVIRIAPTKNGMYTAIDWYLSHFKKTVTNRLTKMQKKIFYFWVILCHFRYGCIWRFLCRILLTLISECPGAAVCLVSKFLGDCRTDTLTRAILNRRTTITYTNKIFYHEFHPLKMACTPLYRLT